MGRPANQDALRTRIRENGLRVTGPRVAVLGKLAAAQEPITHGDLADDLARAGLDRATVFRNLRDLSEAGLVDRVDLGDRVWRYQLRDLARASHVHPHFVCTDCGTIECLEGVDIKVQKRQRVPRAVRDDHVTIHVKGRCDDCAG